jgi:hypothetical protein
MLSKYQVLEAIPEDFDEWEISVRGAKRLHENLTNHRAEAYLYRQLTRLRLDVPIAENLEDLQWQGAGANFKLLCKSLGADQLWRRLPSKG